LQTRDESTGVVELLHRSQLLCDVACHDPSSKVARQDRGIGPVRLDIAVAAQDDPARQESGVVAI
jgi:hypothetical protein